MKVQIKSEEKGLKVELSHLRSKDGVQILRLLANDLSQSEIAKKCSFLKSKVNYWTKKLLKNNFVRIAIPGKPKFYELTPLGTKFLTRGEGGFCPPVIMEDYAMKFGLVRDESSFDWVKLGKPRNWVKMGIKLGRVRVIKTSKNVIIHTGRIHGFDTSNLLVEIGQIIGLAKDFLEHKGVVLDSVGIPLHKPIIRFYTDEAESLNKFGTFFSRNGSIDCSDGVPHVEWNIETAKNYLEMPNRVKRIEDCLDRVSDGMLVFAKGMDQHMMKLIKSLQEVTEEIKNINKGITSKLDF